MSGFGGGWYVLRKMKWLMNEYVCCREWAGIRIMTDPVSFFLQRREVGGGEKGKGVDMGS